MPKSRNRKGHAKKVEARKNEMIRKRKHIDSLMKELETSLATFQPTVEAPMASNYNPHYGN